MLCYPACATPWLTLASGSENARGRSTMKMHPWSGRSRARSGRCWLRCPSGNRQPETEPGPVRSTLLERLEQEVGVAVGQSATFVLDFNQHTVRGRSTPQCHGRPGSGELEGILQQIPHGRGQNRSVRVDARSGSPSTTLSTSPRARASRAAAGASSAMNSPIPN